MKFKKNLNEKPYLEYHRKEIKDDEIKKYREGLINEQKCSGEITGYFEILTPMYTEGFRKDKNELSLSTTFKSQIRITSEFLDLCCATNIFGDLQEASKVEFILLNIEKPLKGSQNIEIPKLFSPRKKITRFYYNKYNISEYKLNHKLKMQQFIKNNIITNSRNKILLRNIYVPRTKVYFKIKYKKLTHDEILILTKALILKENLYHQIGRAKSYGLGTLKVYVDEIFVTNENRYNSLFEKKFSKTITKSVMDIIEKSKDSFTELVFETYKAYKGK